MIIKKLEMFGENNSHNHKIDSNIHGGHFHSGNHTHGYTVNSTTFSALELMQTANKILLFDYDGEVRLVKNRHGELLDSNSDREKVIELLLNELVNQIYNQKLKMFQKAFCEDVKEAIKNVLKNHEIKVKGLYE